MGETQKRWGGEKDSSLALSPLGSAALKCWLFYKLTLLTPTYIGTVLLKKMGLKSVGAGFSLELTPIVGKRCRFYFIFFTMQRWEEICSYWF